MDRKQGVFPVLLENSIKTIWYEFHTSHTYSHMRGGEKISFDDNKSGITLKHTFEGGKNEENGREKNGSCYVGGSEKINCHVQDGAQVKNTLMRL